MGFLTKEEQIVTYDPLRNIEELAESRGLQCFVGNDRLLMIDLDSPEEAEIHATLLEMYKRFISCNTLASPIEAELRTVSQNGGCHVYLKLQEGMEEKDRIAAQAYLGSDRKREMLNFVRLEIHGAALITLFETPEESKRVAEFLGLEVLQNADGNAEATRGVGQDH